MPPACEKLMTEVNQSYALMTALEMQRYRPTQEDLEVFRESMIEQQESGSRSFPEPEAMRRNAI